MARLRLAGKQGAGETVGMCEKNRAEDGGRDSDRASGGVSAGEACPREEGSARVRAAASHLAARLQMEIWGPAWVWQGRNLVKQVCHHGLGTRGGGGGEGSDDG